VEGNQYKEDIVMPGFSDGEALFRFKEQIHIGVMPGSNWYGAPNKIFEYGAARMAVVAPGTPTIQDLFADGKELLLFKQNDVNELYNQLKKYIEDRALMQAHSDALQHKIKNNYSKENTFTFYDGLLRSSKNETI
jgi:glycosyltransferase involved in cell wall biosynthesis